MAEGNALPEPQGGFVIGSKLVSCSSGPLVIAELSGNHNQSLERAIQLVDAAAEAGADAVKLQTYTADTMTLDIREGEFVIDDPASPWNGRSLYELYDEAHTPWEWHEPIFQRVRQQGLIPLSTPFDETAVDFLEDLSCPLYKIASFEITDVPLIRRVAETGKPVIISTGMASRDEIQQAVDTVRACGSDQIVLLKCTSSYPAPLEDLNLKTMTAMQEEFDCLVGLSDHTMSDIAATVATSLGAVVVEKHLTLRRTDGGVDSSFSLEPSEFADLVRRIHDARTALGRITYGTTSADEKSLQFRRSLYFVADLSAGQVVERQHMRAIRPGNGLAPSDLDNVVGQTLVGDARAGTPVSWGSFTANT